MSNEPRCQEIDTHMVFVTSEGRYVTINVTVLRNWIEHRFNKMLNENVFSASRNDPDRAFRDFMHNSPFLLRMEPRIRMDQMHLSEYRQIQLKLTMMCDYIIDTYFKNEVDTLIRAREHYVRS